MASTKAVAAGLGVAGMAAPGVLGCSIAEDISVGVVGAADVIGDAGDAKSPCSASGDDGSFGDAADGGTLG